jgi:hypothetical protein
MKDNQRTSVASKANQQAATLLPKINQLLADHGVDAKVSELHLQPAGIAGAAVKCYWENGVWVCN